MSVVAKVVIHDAAVVERKVGDYKFQSQVGYLQISAHVAHEIQLRVPDAGPYAAGEYLIGAETFRTDDYGRLAISKRGVVLVPAPKPQASR